jgi:putative nucleotidyltransferase with HDIG domain
VIDKLHDARLLGQTAPVRRAERLAALLRQGREHERTGRLVDALDTYAAVAKDGDEHREGELVAEALRRAAGIRRRRNEPREALALYQRSYEVALAIGVPVLAAEALNGIAVLHLHLGDWETAQQYLKRALEVGAESEDLRGRIEQNFGVMANIEGDIAAAVAHYERSLRSFRAAGNDGGCAIAYNNLGMLNSDRARWDDAERYFHASFEIAESIGDVGIRAHVLLNRTEVDLGRARYEDARTHAEQALQLFDQLGARDHKANAYKFLGMLYRETGRPMLAEARLKTAIDLAAEVGASLFEAEASRELALLYQGLGRNQDALRLLNASHRLFGRVNARRDLVDIHTKVAHLESVYLAIVRDWGRSIESTDSYTFGHSERVASYAAAVAQSLGLDDADITTVRIGAYLHDLGKVRIPHEILNKPGKLTAEEFAIMKLHPEYGLEMLASVEFPWDIKPIIRSHHEKLNGTGYPDRLRGDEIPLTAQVICVVDVYDALTTTRSYRAAMDHTAALVEMQTCTDWWRPDVLAGFLGSIDRERQPRTGQALTTK